MELYISFYQWLSHIFGNTRDNNFLKQAEKEKEQEPSERKEASWGVGEGLKRAAMLKQEREWSQCPSLRGPSLEEGAWCPSGGDTLAAGGQPGGGGGSR